ncbi:helix-turn-helix transcriptional regulator [Micromonospora arborensis]|uniref:helix-turn-helix transcriptional regulator n=1 Tax=Micromonospora arborensis TaxID=2116518 RepID=UPI0033F40D2F
MEAAAVNGDSSLGTAATPLKIGGSQAELSALLRAWRRRLAPANVPGFVQYPHRRKSTLSQDDIARLVGSTSFWYGQLERGHVGRYSDDFLDRVAAALQLSDSEREVLYHLAVGRQPVPRHRPSAEVSQTMERLVAAQQCPAYIVDSAFNVRAWNVQAQALFPWLTGEPNLMRWAFTTPAARTQLHRWEEDWAPSLLAQLRMAHAREPDNESLAQVIRDVIASNERARWCWENEPSVTDPGEAVRGIRIPDCDTPVRVELIVCSPLGHPGMQMVIMVAVEQGSDVPTVRTLTSASSSTSGGRAA